MIANVGGGILSMPLADDSEPDVLVEQLAGDTAIRAPTRSS